MGTAVSPAGSLQRVKDLLGRLFTVKPCVPKEMNPPLNPVLVTDAEGLERVRSFLASVDLYGLDIETNVEPTFFTRKIRTIQVGNRDIQFVIDLLAFAGSTENLIFEQGEFGERVHTLRPVVDVLRPSLEALTHTKAGANLEFEYVQLRWCLGLRPWNFFDIQLAEKNMYCGKVDFFTKGFWALDDLAVRYCGIQIDKTLQTSFNLTDPLTPAQLDYAVLDVRVPLAIMKAQLAIGEKDGLLHTFKIDNDTIPTSGEMHIRGFYLDRPSWVALLDDIRVRHKANIAKLDDFFVPICGEAKIPDYDLVALEAEWKATEPKVKGSVRRKVAAERYRAARAEITLATKKLSPDKKGKIAWIGKAKINYASPTELLGVLRTIGYGKDRLKSTDDDDLKRLAGDPLIEAIQAYRETEKILKTYDEKWLDKSISPISGRVHSRFNVLGAETGRMSSDKPNLFNILKDKLWRACFKAPKGRKIVTIDYAGQELRILTDQANYDKWIEAFAKGQDVHSICAEDVLEEEWINARVPGCNYYEQDKKKCDENVCKVHDEKRKPFKNINFGIAYGMSKFKYAADIVGKVLKKLLAKLGLQSHEATDEHRNEAYEQSLSEGDRLLEKWKKKNAVVWTFLVKKQKQASTTFEARTASGRRRFFTKPIYENAAVKAKAKIKKKWKVDRDPTNKEIISMLGQMRGAIEREGANTGIQGTGADMTKTAMGCGFDKDGKPYLFHTLPQYDAFLVNAPYDELVAECPEEHAQAVYDLIGDAMRRAGAEFVTRVTMEYEGHIDDHWRK